IGKRIIARRSSGAAQSGGIFLTPVTIELNDRERNPPEVSRLLRGARPPDRTQLVAGARQRPHVALHERRDESVQGCLHWLGKTRLSARGVLPEMRPGGRKAQRSR